MQAWMCETLDGPAALQWRERPTPQPAADEVLVAIHAASLNFPDLLSGQGKYQMRPELPFAPGAEFAGIIEAVGADVRHLRPGMPVTALGGHGGFATHAVVKAMQVMPLPAGSPLRDAAAFAFTYGTAHPALIDRAALQAGETVLVLGAAGGVGTAAIQIAKAAGATVIAAASTDAKCGLCRQIGADVAINYATMPLRDALKDATKGKGVDVVFDPVGGSHAEPAFRAIAWRGRYLVIGFAEGGIPALPWNLPLLKGASIVGVFWGDFVRREPAANARMLGVLAAQYARGLVKPVIDEIIPLSRLADAYHRLENRQILGKLVMVPDALLET
ncbi:MAG: NADPH:quinone oxidoreductase family protein [Caulobacter sp.]|nr:NADPH:quinone oxidoreductase family protein [Vitreoscilla sp.]